MQRMKSWCETDTGSELRMSLPLEVSSAKQPNWSQTLTETAKQSAKHCQTLSQTVAETPKFVLANEPSNGSNTQGGVVFVGVFSSLTLWPNVCREYLCGSSDAAQFSALFDESSPKCCLGT
eukprot:TRINITY_DN66774_c5_g7_i3.p2 TRINITY_DN66774_c5_g7~~TRINITY_DN66774_c5_g7_i3.p2  ORF type:complete len:121 (-),score=18.08 TRINITY_DN66774_c5_g7_i3:195-557(-)